MGLLFDKNQRLRYNVRAKKAFFITTDGDLSLNVKGRCDVDKDFRQVCYVLLVFFPSFSKLLSKLANYSINKHVNVLKASLHSL